MGQVGQMGQMAEVAEAAEVLLAVLDYGMGNLRSVSKALELAAREFPELKVVVTGDPVEASRATGVVLPGVGAFGAAMANLERSGLDRVVREAIADGRPFLGICLGLQLLFDESAERFAEDTLPRGLGILPGRVRRFPAGLKVPQIGWNQLSLRSHLQLHPQPHLHPQLQSQLEPRKPGNPLWRGVQQGAYTYFVHSYYVEPQDPEVIAATSDYGIEFTAAVWRENLFALQFHPEKSSQVGLQMLRNFAAAVVRAAGASDFFLPAIDLRDGRCVRLVQGDPGRETRYSDDPVTVAKELARQGARRLHVVDLDGAFAGEPRQLELVAAIRRAVPEVRVELGGGLRTLEQIEAAFAAGVKDVIVGSALLSNEELVAEACRRHPGQVTAGVDVRDGRVAVSGWQEESSVAAVEAVRRAAALGVRRFILTDISQDGMLSGPNFGLIRGIAEAVAQDAADARPVTAVVGRPSPELEFVVSGGVRSAEDVRAAAALGLPVTGVIAGRALYDRRLTVGEALAAARRGLILRPEPARAGGEPVAGAAVAGEPVAGAEPAPQPEFRA